MEDLLKPVDPEYECTAFRAANWAVSPSRNVVRALVSNGVRFDTSVFKHGRREGIVSFDYSNAHSDLVPWPVDENDICRRNDKGKLIEVPIYCERRWIGAFVTRNRIHRAMMSRGHQIKSGHQTDGAGLPPGRPGKPGLVHNLSLFARRHAWKADFNQCTGRQLIRALERAQLRYGPVKEELPFVLIGHSKLFTRFNEWSLWPFLAHVGKHPSRFEFGRFSDFGLR